MGSNRQITGVIPLIVKLDQLFTIIEGGAYLLACVATSPRETMSFLRTGTAP